MDIGEWMRGGANASAQQLLMGVGKPPRPAGTESHFGKPVRNLFIDPELGEQGFNYDLVSGDEGSVRPVSAANRDLTEDAGVHESRHCLVHWGLLRPSAAVALFTLYNPCSAAYVPPPPGEVNADNAADPVAKQRLLGLGALQ